jgi:hypothetical protein
MPGGPHLPATGQHEVSLNGGIQRLVVQDNPNINQLTGEIDIYANQAVPATRPPGGEADLFIPEVNAKTFPPDS